MKNKHGGSLNDPCVVCPAMWEVEFLRKQNEYLTKLLRQKVLLEPLRVIVATEEFNKLKAEALIKNG